MSGACCIIFYDPLNYHDHKSHIIEPNTVFFDWLQREYPNGFGRPIMLIVNKQACALEDMDFVCNDNDVISVIVTPAGPLLVTELVITLISAVATLVASLIVNLIFGKPKTKDQANPDPVYSLQGGQNMIRLGEPVPVIYGRVVTFPDAATLPYSFFNNNNQYIDQILCLGQGEFDIYDIMIGDTPVRNLAPGVVTWQAFAAANHNQTIGVIEAATGIRELCSTSIEVQDQEFPGGTGGASLVYYVANTSGNSITFQTKWPAAVPIGSVLPISSGPDAGTQAIVTAYSNVSGTATVSNSLSTATGVSVPWYDDSAAPGTTAGPFITSNPGYPGYYIEVDFTFPSGLYTLDKNGNFISRSMQIQVTADPIDDTNAVNGSSIIQTFTFSQATNTPQRITRGFNVPVGRYRVRVTRLTAPPPNNKTQDMFVWTGLKFQLSYPTGPVYGPVTLIAIRLQATNGIASDSANKIRVIATRRLRNVSQGGVMAATRSPSDAFFDICTNTIYGLGRPAANIDTDTLTTMEAHWGQTYAIFDGIFSTKTTVWEALTSVLQPVVAIPVRTGKVISLVSDGQKIAPMQMFSDANILKTTFQASYSFDRPGDYAGYQIEYRDQINFLPAYVNYPLDSVDYETVTLFGCTDPTIALQYAKLLWQKQLRQRQFCTFQTDMEGFIPQVGSRILVSTNAVSWGLGGEVIDAVTNSVLQLDRHIDLTTFTNPLIVLRDDNGVPSVPIPITAGDTPDVVVLNTTLPFDISPVLGDRRATEWAIGDQVNKVKDFTIQSVEHSGTSATTVTAVIYDERAWAGTLAFLDVPI
jgi:hypothetical protein